MFIEAGYIYDVVLLSSSSYRLKFCENLPRKIISITPFTTKSDSNYHCNQKSLQIY